MRKHKEPKNFKRSGYFDNALVGKVHELRGNKIVGTGYWFAAKHHYYTEVLIDGHPQWVNNNNLVAADKETKRPTTREQSV